LDENKIEGVLEVDCALASWGILGKIFRSDTSLIELIEPDKMRKILIIATTHFILLW
jgi:hypothetical protein